MGARYRDMYENDDGWCDWVQPVMKGYKLACCDCGLVHDMEFAVNTDRVLFRARRNDRSTSAKRRKRG